MSKDRAGRNPVIATFKIAEVGDKKGDLGQVTVRENGALGVTLKKSMVGKTALENGRGWKIEGSDRNTLEEGATVTARTPYRNRFESIVLKLGRKVS